MATRSPRAAQGLAPRKIAQTGQAGQGRNAGGGVLDPYIAGRGANANDRLGGMHFPDLDADYCCRYSPRPNIEGGTLARQGERPCSSICSTGFAKGSSAASLWAFTMRWRRWAPRPMTTRAPAWPRCCRQSKEQPRDRLSPPARSGSVWAARCGTLRVRRNEWGRVFTCPPRRSLGEVRNGKCASEARPGRLQIDHCKLQIDNLQ